jgi:sortase (surface protein transpeptidase)
MPRRPGGLPPTHRPANLPRTDRRRFIVAALSGLGGLALRPTRGVAQAPEEAEDAEVEEPWPAEQPPAATEIVASGVRPVTLAIPALRVEAAVVPVELDEDGAMAAPGDPDTVAWYALGPGMGVGGNAVFAAHVDWGGRPRVFGRLAALRPGDGVLVVDERGNGYQYVVESSEWVRAEGAPVEEIFAQGESPVITLITCGGTYVPVRREYLDRLIVRAVGA